MNNSGKVITLKKRFIKITSIVLTLVFIASTFTGMSFTASAGSKGSQSASTSSQDNAAKVSMSLYDASYTSGNTATYIVDKYYYKTMADFGNMYAVTFEGFGMYAFTDITASGAFSISNSGHRDTFMINPQQNAPGTATDTGTLVGAVPEPGTSKSVTIRANVTVNWNNPALLNGMPVFSNSTSVSMTAVVIGVDSTQLQNEILIRSEYIESCWTPDSWATFAQALDNAKSVASSKTALQDEIDNALAQLIEARQGLVHAGDITECEYCAGQSNGNETKTIESFYDLSYGNSNMDLFLPANAEGNCALIVFIHGGAWVSDDKASFTGWALDACRKYGIAAASVNYRYADCFNVTGWGILDDIQSAVAKIKSVAAERGLNITKMMTAGHSAGGHLSLMYAYTKKDTSPARPVCVFDMSGPAALYNPEYLKDDGLILALNAVSGVYFTREQAALAYGALLEMSPVHYVNSETVPTLICHGALDIIVPYSDSVALDMNLTNAGVAHTFITFPLSNHGLESNPECYEQMMQEYDRYVRTYLLPGEVPTILHHYNEEVVQPTCTSKGYTVYSCVDCGRYYVSDVNGPHIPGEWEVTTPATETTDGLEVIRCTVCHNIIEERIIPKTASETVDIIEKEESGIAIDKENKLICGFKDIISSAEDITEKINVVGNAEIEVAPTENGYGTGTVVNVIVDNEVVDSYNVIILGDATGDAVIDESDFVLLDLYIAMIQMTEDSTPQFLGMDCTKDGVVDESDIVLVDLANAFLGEIDQINGGIIFY